MGDINTKCELEERKLIDYIPEPYRQDLLDLDEKLRNLESKYLEMIPKFLEEPQKLVTHEDLATVFQTLRL